MVLPRRDSPVPAGRLVRSGVTGIARLAGRTPAASARPRRTFSYRSRGSIASVLSAGSLASFASIGSALSLFSIASLSSSGSILSIGSAGSILSIGSAGSILSIGSAGSILTIGSSGSAPGAPDRNDEEAAATPGRRAGATVRTLATMLALAAAAGGR